MKDDSYSRAKQASLAGFGFLLIYLAIALVMFSADIKKFRKNGEEHQVIHSVIDEKMQELIKRIERLENSLNEREIR